MLQINDDRIVISAALRQAQRRPRVLQLALFDRAVQDLQQIFLTDGKQIL